MAPKGVELASSYVSLMVDPDQLAKQVNSAVAATVDRVTGKPIGTKLAHDMGAAAAREMSGNSSVGKALEDSLKGSGRRAADSFTRDINGRLRDERGRFIKLGAETREAITEGMSKGGANAAAGFTRDINGRLRDANGRFVKSGEAIGKSVSDGLKRGTPSSWPGLDRFFSRVEQQGISAARKTGGAISGALKTGLKGALSATGIGLGISGAMGISGVLSGGLDRLKTIQSAQVQLSVMHKSAGEIRSIIADVTDVVTGTSVNLAEAMNAVPQALGAGVKEGAQLKQYMKDIADATASTGGQRSFQDVSVIFGQILGKGKLQLEELNQLEEGGVHIKNALMEAFKWDQKEFNKQMSRGKVGMKEIQFAIEQTFGQGDGLAKQMGNTFDGAVSQMNAAKDRLGANFISAIFGTTDADDPLKGATDGVNKLTEHLKGMETWVVAHEDDIRGFFTQVGDVAEDVASSLGTVSGVLREHPGLIKAIPLAFIGWKSITGLTAMVGTLKGLKDILTGIPGWTKTAGAALADMSGGVAAGGGKTPPVVAGGGGSGALATLLKLFPLLMVGGVPDQKDMRELLPEADRKAFDDAMARGDLAAANAIVQRGGGLNLNLGLPQANAANSAPFNPGPKAPAYRDSAPGAAMPWAGGQSPQAMPTGEKYGLPKGSAINYGQKGFPDWVYSYGKNYGVEASTYAGHQEGSGSNRGIDWRPAGVDVNTPEGAAIMDKFAESLMSMPGVEQVIWENPFTGKRVGRDPGDRGANQSIDDYYRNDWAGHRDHVHTRFSQSLGIPAPPLGTIKGLPSAQDPTGGLLSRNGNSATPAPLALPGGGLGASRSDLGKLLGSRLKASGLSSDQILGIMAMNQVESGGNAEGFLGFTFGQAGNPTAAIDRFLSEQWSPRTKGGIPGVDGSGKVTNWDEYLKFLRVNIVGQQGVVDWQGNQQPPAQVYQQRLSDALNNNRGEFNSWLGLSSGGSVWGAGTETSDDIPAMLSTGEHVLTASDVRAMGGQNEVYKFRNALHRSGGGAIQHFDDGGAPDPNVIRDAQNNLADLQNQVAVSQARMNEIMSGDDPDPSAIMSAQQTFESNQRAFLQAQEALPYISRGATPPDHGFENRIFGADNTAAMAQAQLDALKDRDDVPASQLMQAQYEAEAARRDQQTARDDYAQSQKQPSFLDELLRTQGFKPANAGNTGVAGTSSLAGYLNMGNQVVGGLIDTGASLAQTAVSGALAAGTFGASAAAGPAAGAAAGYGIQLGASALKRTASYWFQLGSIGADALVEQFMPFGAPRWLGYDYTGFAPQLGIQQALLTTAEKMGSQAISNYFNPKTPGSVPPMPAAPTAPGEAGGALGAGISMNPGVSAPPDASSAATAAGGQLGTEAPLPPPKDPYGTSGSAPNTAVSGPGAKTWLQELQGRIPYSTGGPVGIYDQGGVLEPGQLAFNASRIPEKVLTQKQWDSIRAGASEPSQLQPLVGTMVTADQDEAFRKLANIQRRNMMQYAGRP